MLGLLIALDINYLLNHNSWGMYVTSIFYNSFVIATSVLHFTAFWFLLVILDQIISNLEKKKKADKEEKEQLLLKLKRRAVHTFKDEEESSIDTMS